MRLAGETNKTSFGRKYRNLLTVACFSSRCFLQFLLAVKRMESDKIPVSQDMLKEISVLYSSEELQVYNLLSMFADGSITKWCFMHEIGSLKMVNFPWHILLYRNSLIENTE